MSILSEKIDDVNNDGKEVKDSKASVKKAIEAYEKMKPALAKAEEKKRSAKPKVFKVDIKEEPKKLIVMLIPKTKKDLPMPLNTLFFL